MATTRARDPDARWLDGAVASLMPTAEHDWLLRACLDPGEAGQAAWRLYLGHASDPRHRIGMDPRTRVLAPLLHHALRRQEDSDRAFHTYLRTAYLREALRSRNRQRIVGAVLAALVEAGIDGIALGETALDETVYDEPALRHSGAVDVLLRDADTPAAVRAAERLGFALDPAAGARPGDAALRHELGLPLRLRTHLFRWPCHGLPEEETWARSRPGAVAGVPVRLLSPADGLVQVCGDLFDAPVSPGLQWAADAWSLVRRAPTMDWTVLHEAAERGRLAVPLAVTLGHLARRLGAPIPPDLLAALRESTRRADPLARDMALRAARRASWRGLWGTIANAPGWTGRLAVVGHTLFPSRAYLQLTQGAGDPGAASHLRRLGHGARAAVRAAARRAG
jgi:hypothetical protein